MCSRTLRDFGVPGRFYKMDHFQRRSPSYLNRPHYSHDAFGGMTFKMTQAGPAPP